MIINNSSTEFKLLVITLKVFLATEQSKKINFFLNNNDINWLEFKKLTNYHKLGTIVYRQLLKSNIPSDIATSFKLILVKQNIRVKKQIKETLSTLKLLKKNEIESVTPFKGFILSDLLYNDYHLRQSVDIDFAIDSNDIKKIIPLLESEGFEFGKKQEYESLGAKRYIKNNTDIVFYKKGNFSLEFHWRVNQTRIDFKNNSAIINVHKYVKKNINNNELFILAPNEHLRQLYLHHIFSDNLNKLYHWVEIAKCFQNLKQLKHLQSFLDDYSYVKNDLILDTIKELFDLNITPTKNTNTQKNKTNAIIKTLTTYKNLNKQEFTSKFLLLKRTLTFIRPFNIKLLFSMNRLYTFIKPWGTDYNIVNLPKSLFFMYFFVRIYRVVTESFKSTNSKG